MDAPNLTRRPACLSPTTGLIHHKRLVEPYKLKPTAAVLMFLLCAAPGAECFQVYVYVHRHRWALSVVSQSTPCTLAATLHFISLDSATRNACVIRAYQLAAQHCLHRLLY